MTPDEKIQFLEEQIQKLLETAGDPIVDSNGGCAGDGALGVRVEKLEAQLTSISTDVAVIKANGATKTDMAELKSTTQTDMAELKSATQADIAELKSETRADIAELRSSTKADIAELRSSTKADIAELKSSMKADLAEAKTAIIMWVVGAIFLAQLLPTVVRIFVG